MDLPSRIPILRNNPVFVLEARRVWGHHGIVGVSLGVAALVVCFGVLVREPAAIGRVSLALLRAGIPVDVLPELAVTLEIAGQPLRSPAAIPDVCLIACVLTALFSARFFIPIAAASVATSVRQRDRLHEVVARHVPVSGLMWGRLWVLLIPWGVVLIPLSLCSCLARTGDAIPPGLAALFVVCAIGVPATATVVSLAACVRARDTVAGTARAYIAVWGALGAWWAVILAGSDWASWWRWDGPHPAGVSAVSLGLVALIAWTAARRALIRLGASP